MPKTPDRAVRTWLFVFAGVVGFLIVFGGFVRLTRSGLSITEWDPVTGVIPPIGEAAWQREFASYQQTPEFKLINHAMTLAEYKYIFAIEWTHRLVARLAGLYFALPFFYFLIRRKIPWRQAGIYVLMGSLFLAQAFAGWYMVASGLLDRPAVSHFRLTIHLLLALSLLALSLWVALEHHFGFAGPRKRTPLSCAASAALVVLIVQMAYGGLSAGLKAGHLSNTWPLMFGRLIPPGLVFNLPRSLESAVTVFFVHRWLAFAGLLLIPLLYTFARARSYSRAIQRGLAWVGLVALVQVTLGVLTVLRNVPIVTALLHQTNAVVLFALSIVVLHRAGAPGARVAV